MASNTAELLSSPSDPQSLWPGLGAAIAVSAISLAVGLLEERTLGRAVIEPLVLAILVGMSVRTITPDWPTGDAGIRFASKNVLEVAVFLLGATMDVPRLFASGPALAVGIVLLVVAALAAGYAV